MVFVHDVNDPVECDRVKRALLSCAGRRGIELREERDNKLPGVRPNPKADASTAAGVYSSADPLGRASQISVPCNKGASCPFFAQGRCRFLHD